MSTVPSTFAGRCFARRSARGASDCDAAASASANGESRRKRPVAIWCAASSARLADATAATSTTPTTVFDRIVRKTGSASTKSRPRPPIVGRGSSGIASMSSTPTASATRSVRSRRASERNCAAQPTAVASAVAAAAPATPHPRPATKITSTMTLMMAAYAHARNGDAESPRAIDAACAVCQASCNGNAIPRMRQYVVAGASTAAVERVT
mmetsp:Transcript_22134/g.69278  ORF Transcript_22134/g.69278 Transcript_22134/m.69278 type:complete len:210 (-) Transcript_22134:930-1559(-)